MGYSTLISDSPRVPRVNIFPTMVDGHRYGTRVEQLSKSYESVREKLTTSRKDVVLDLVDHVSCQGSNFYRT